MTQKIKNIMLLCLLAISAIQSNAQWQTFGNLLDDTEWFGGNATSTIDLQIRNDANFGIQFHTNSGYRMLLQPNGALNFGLNATNTLGIGNCMGLGYR